ncbi:MAG TPA: hypothetical protein VEW74_06260 [Candidatus Nitrosotalea sp.]|nr:hypothetical protein [Candidatus Nitrosotalea sp.]
MRLSLTVETLTDEIRQAFWTRAPYRHVRLGVTVRNDGDAYQSVLLEVLLPESVFITVPGGGANWNPSHRHELEGQNFLAWDTFGGFGRNAVPHGDVILHPTGRVEDVLDVDLKPEANPLPLFWRLFERNFDEPGEPFHRTKLELTRYVPRL